MTECSRPAAANVGSLVCLSALCLVPMGLLPTATADPRTDYMLDCMGCHRANGAGVPGKVPDMRSSLVLLSGTPEGRRYLVEVPGVAQAPLSSAALAHLLNWMVHHLSAAAAPRSFRRFTEEEVAAYRKIPLVDVIDVRRRLLAAAAKQPAGR
ncbi:MAG TPA: hypothetical protein VFA39_21260 [Steroidobacteraceae bacterium]|nr:hypothetical protein [Steroidobacteraceae bacterium]